MEEETFDERMTRLRKEKEEYDRKERQRIKDLEKEWGKVAAGMAIIAAAELSNPETRKKMFGKGFWIAILVGVVFLIIALALGGV